MLLGMQQTPLPLRHCWSLIQRYRIPFANIISTECLPRGSKYSSEGSGARSEPSRSASTSYHGDSGACGIWQVRVTAHMDLAIVMTGGQEAAKENIDRCWLWQYDDDLRKRARTRAQWPRGWCSCGRASGSGYAAARAASRRTVVGVKRFMAERVIGVLKSGLEFERRVEGSRVEKEGH